MTDSQHRALTFRPAEREEIAEIVRFLDTDTWPFHSPPTADDRPRAEVVEKRYFDETVAAFWGETAEGEKAVLMRLFDLGDITPLFDLRIRTAYRGRGYGRESLAWLTRHLFETRADTDRLAGYTRRDNVPMRRTFLACGYVKEAHYRRTWPDHEGKLIDTVGYGTLRHD